jgi:hypothetical protein
MVKQIIQKVENFFGWHGTLFFVSGMCLARTIECFRHNDLKTMAIFAFLSVVNCYAGYITYCIDNVKSGDIMKS